ncbi:matrixin family metalloprotease [Nitratireductor mangrovi]|uniref:Matrixin family metalloprotease n=1 Tax=Nitratireductor mangrovi TaxID=2599600 RepID=A0A6H0DXU9_9HYPH|nr:M10 family metallopeptidase C-terminal domain-containing protein [Nitratireductor mangrovi]QIS94618.1 matrixin family metalloprotease [Nitratireductor mangrovi]
MSAPIFTSEQITRQLRTQWRDGTPDNQTRDWSHVSSVDYYIGDLPANNGQPENASWVPMSDTGKAAAALAFELWDDLIAINLNRVFAPAQNQIQFQYATSTQDNGTYAKQQWQDSTDPSDYGGLHRELTRSDIWFSTTWATHNEDSDLLLGLYGFQTYIHEIGHALGLSHPGDYNAGPGQVITYENDAEFAQDTRHTTVMSYFGGYDKPTKTWVTEGSASALFHSSTPLIGDIAAIQAAYGADMTTRTGDTTYGYNSTAGSIYDFNFYSSSSVPIFAIWDAGGTDTLDGSGTGLGQDINLNAGTYSSMAGETENVGIAYGAVIENAIGGTGNDTIRGNAANNSLSGGAGNDTLFGGDGTDTLSGGGDNDILDGGSGADQLDGGSGVDTADYSASAGRVNVSLSTGTALGGDAHGDTLSGIENLIGTNSSLTDFLTGNSLANRIEGLAGDDFLAGLGGADVLIGGSGVDTADYSASTQRIAVNLASGKGFGGDAQGDTLSGIENLIGTNSSLTDFLTGNSLANRIEGLAGDDLLAGLGGADVLIGGSGIDTADYSASTGRINVNLSTGTGLGGDAHGDTLSGIENLIGTNVSLGDFLTGDGGNNVIAGLAGPDQINGMGGVDTADYSASTQRIAVNLASGKGFGGDAQGDTLSGIENLIGTNSSLTDFLTGNSLANRIEGLAGDDLLAGLGGADVLIGGSGIDTADYSASTGRINVNLSTGTGLGGDAHGDTLSGIENLIGTNVSLGDFLTGDGGNNVIAGLAGPDQINGMGGIDTADYSASAGRINVNLSTGTGLGGDAHGDTLSGIENLIGTNSSLTDFLTGDAFANTIAGLAGADQIDGMGGIDTADYSASAGRINVNLTNGTGLGGDAHGDTLSGIENLIGTNSSLTDFLTGNSLANRIEGLAGDDLIAGLGGADILIGGAGVDTADYSASGGRINVDLSTGTGLGGDAHGDTLSGIENLIGTNIAMTDFLTGNAFANTIAGLAGADQIDGMGGIDTADYSASAGRINVNLSTGAGLGGDAHGDTLSGIENLIGTNSSLTDFLTGDGGNNVIAGLAGADQINGMGGIDTADYSASTGRVNVNLSNGTGLGGDAHGDTLSGIENLIGTNVAMTDFLTGDASANRIEGLAGDDEINGKEGTDIFVGGGGDDLFIFDTALGAGNIDAILDFVVADDMIRLASSIFTGLSAGGLTAAAFRVGAAAADADDRVIYNAGSGGLFFDVDGNGAQGQVQFASLSTGLALTNDNFLVA